MPRRPHTRSTSIFLTYPHSEISKEDLFKKLKEKYDPKQLVVCKESHRTGEPHLHAFMKVGSRTRFYWDDLTQLAGKQGNYKAARNNYASIQYIAKYGDYLAHGLDVEQYLSARKLKKNPKSNHVAQLIMKGTTIEDLLKEDHLTGYVMEKLNKIREFQVLTAEIKASKDLFPFDVPTVNPLQSPEDAKIAKWLHDNIRKPRPLNTKQLWIYGHTCMGKSTLIDNLSKMIKVYVFDNMNSNFVDGLNDTYDLCIFDEYKADRTIQFMNQFSDGSRMTINQKGGRYIKTKNFPLIVLSNYTPEECYHKVALTKPHILDTLKRRFIIVNVTKPISLYRNYVFQRPNRNSESNQQEKEFEDLSSNSPDASPDTHILPVIPTPMIGGDADLMESSSEVFEFPIRKRKRPKEKRFTSLKRTKGFMTNLSAIPDKHTLDTLMASTESDEN